jgi:hypothetical protein
VVVADVALGILANFAHEGLKGLLRRFRPGPTLERTVRDAFRQSLKSAFPHGPADATVRAVQLAEAAAELLPDGSERLTRLALYSLCRAEPETAAELDALVSTRLHDEPGYADLIRSRLRASYPATFEKLLTGDVALDAERAMNRAVLAELADQRAAGRAVRKELDRAIRSPYALRYLGDHLAGQPASHARLLDITRDTSLFTVQREVLGELWGPALRVVGLALSVALERDSPLDIGYLTWMRRQLTISQRVDTPLSIGRRATLRAIAELLNSQTGAGPDGTASTLAVAWACVIALGRSLGEIDGPVEPLLREVHATVTVESWVDGDPRENPRETITSCLVAITACRVLGAPDDRVSALAQPVGMALALRLWHAATAIDRPRQLDSGAEPSLHYTNWAAWFALRQVASAAQASLGTTGAAPAGTSTATEPAERAHGGADTAPAGDETPGEDGPAGGDRAAGLGLAGDLTGYLEQLGRNRFTDDDFETLVTHGFALLATGDPATTALVERLERQTSDWDLWKRSRAQLLLADRTARLGYRRLGLRILRDAMQQVALLPELIRDQTAWYGVGQLLRGGDRLDAEVVYDVIKAAQLEKSLQRSLTAVVAFAMTEPRRAFAALRDNLMARVGRAPDELIEAADRLHRAGLPGAARALVGQVAAAAHGPADLWRSGLAWSRIGELESARAQFDRALAAVETLSGETTRGLALRDIVSLQARHPREVEGPLLIWDVRDISVEQIGAEQEVWRLLALGAAGRWSGQPMEDWAPHFARAMDRIDEIGRADGAPVDWFKLQLQNAVLRGLAGDTRTSDSFWALRSPPAEINRMDVLQVVCALTYVGAGEWLFHQDYLDFSEWRLGQLMVPFVVELEARTLGWQPAMRLVPPISDPAVRAEALGTVATLTLPREPEPARRAAAEAMALLETLPADGMAARAAFTVAGALAATGDRPAARRALARGREILAEVGTWPVLPPLAAELMKEVG